MSDIRFLELYDYRDEQRHQKWLHSGPTDLFEINRRRLKQLLALNLKRKMKETLALDADNTE